MVTSLLEVLVEETASLLLSQVPLEHSHLVGFALFFTINAYNLEIAVSSSTALGPLPDPPPFF